MYRIVRREQFSDTTFLWDVEAPDVARAAQPGQFVMVRLREGGERIPLTVADYDRDAGTITLVVQVAGRTTREMMRLYRAGDVFGDFVGPLGLAAHVDRVGHVVLVGGGLGVAPVFPQLRAFKEAGNRVTGILGFRTKDLVFWEERFAPYCDELVVCTDDGSYGRPGLVTGAVEAVIGNGHRPDRIVAIGPLPMMRAVAETTRPSGVTTIVSLNAIMVDGTGMCGSCRVSVGGKVRFACVDGPDFDAHQVDFAELSLRQQRFRSHEQTARDDYDRVCSTEEQLFKLEKKNYKKIKELAPKATPMPERDAAERARTFDEVNLGWGMSEALAEAERCIQCLKPTCIQGCPVSIDIPRFIRHLLVRDMEGALGAIHDSNLFPSICGRVCPQESQCEAQCVIGRKVEPVAIGRLERFVGDHAPAPRRTRPARASIGRVAVVGSGPAGLSCAGDLAREGAEVTVYEALHVPGGVLRYGIPSFRLPRPTIDREVAALVEMGVRIETNKVVGRTFTIPQLLGEMGYDAVFVGVGAGFPVFLNIPGEFAGRVYSANEFLTRVNLMGGDRFPYEDTPVSLGNSVVVIGAGNTAMDCLRVSKRLGAAHVRCVYRRTEAEAPARVEEIRHAKEEGIEFHWLHGPTEIQTDERGEVRGIVCQRMELGPPDASGRRSPVPIEGDFATFECDTVIYALGTRANPVISQSTPGLQLDKRGYIAADPVLQATSLPGVFAGGDIVTGGATVILALGAGRRAAKGILGWLRDRTWPPKVDEPAPAPAPGTKACSRCQQPLSGDEEYVCCAGLELSWQCESCRKVWEGFALPYGLCPACGGRLLRDRPRVAPDEAKEAVRQALEIELGGAAFYDACAVGAKDAEVAALFSKLADMEREHREQLVRRYHVSVPPAAEVATSKTAAAVFAGCDVPGDDPADVLRLAVKLEDRARAILAARALERPAGSAQAALYRELEAEEKEHEELLQTALDRLLEGRSVLI